MKDELNHAVKEASINGVFIFAYSLGLGILAKTWGVADLSYTFIMLQSGGLALVRFATRLREEDYIDANGLENVLPMGSRKGITDWGVGRFAVKYRLGKVI